MRAAVVSYPARPALTRDFRGSAAIAPGTPAGPPQGPPIHAHNKNLAKEWRSKHSTTLNYSVIILNRNLPDLLS